MGNHQAHALEVFNRTTHKVVKDTISYAHIQVNNAYYKDVLGQKMKEGRFFSNLLDRGTIQPSKDF
jgi:hypothetical protein